MKRYEVYRNIRKRAMVMGLPISFFAMMMVSVICSLLIIIFSFGFGVIVGLLLANALFYGALVQWVKKPFQIVLAQALTTSLSNKNISPYAYGED